VGPYYATPSWDQTLPTSTRFIILSNFASAAVLDRETGLVWERSPETATVDWNSARSSCISKNVGGRKGWRLPAIAELTSLVDPTQNPALPAGHPFTTVLSARYISASTSRINTPSAWGVDFGEFGNGPVINLTKIDAEHRVWCVRGAMQEGVY
jgi:hypothetical protein